MINTNKMQEEIMKKLFIIGSFSITIIVILSAIYISVMKSVRYEQNRIINIISNEINSLSKVDEKDLKDGGELPPLSKEAFCKIQVLLKISKKIKSGD